MCCAPAATTRPISGRLRKLRLFLQVCLFCFCLQLETQPLDLAAQIGKSCIGRKGSLGGRRPPTIRARRTSQGSQAVQQNESIHLTSGMCTLSLFVDCGLILNLLATFYCTDIGRWSARAAISSAVDDGHLSVFPLNPTIFRQNNATRKWRPSSLAKCGPFSGLSTDEMRTRVRRLFIFPKIL